VHVTVSALDPTVEVPDIRQQAVGTAQAQLAAAGLRLAQRGSQASVQAAGIVLSQDPVGGSRAPTGSSVVVVVSAGGLVVVPALIGRQQSAAVTLLRSVGLGFSSDEILNLSRVPGTVVSQDPGAGAQVPVGSVVDMLVASRQIRDPSDGPIIRKPGVQIRDRIDGPIIRKPGFPPTEIP
jgi:serine/threonine-protein kinase